MNISLLLLFLLFILVLVRIMMSNWLFVVLFFCLLVKDLHIVINLLILIDLGDIYTAGVLGGLCLVAW